MHRFFDDLRQEGKPHNRMLFDFADDELWWCPPKDRERLIPKWASKAKAERG